MYIDSHAHFDLILEKSAEDEAAVLDAMSRGGVTIAVQIGIDVPRSIWSRDFARRNADRGILYSVGIHPSSLAGHSDCKAIEELASSGDERLFGIGECGLDYYRMRRTKEDQRESFLYQADLARRLNLPLIVHSRDAMDDTIDLLAEAGPPRGIMHCFSGDRNAAKRVLDLGFHIAFAGNVTYRRADDIREAARYVPSQRLLVETDAPFLTPEPMRGRDNRPDYIVHTLHFLADIRNTVPDRLAEAVSQNFKELIRNGK